MTLKTFVRWVALVFVAACIATSAHALDRGLYMVDSSGDYWFVDENGMRHQVQNFDTVKSHWFADTPILHTTSEVISGLPTGEVITETVGPEMVVKKTTTTTVTGDG